MDAVTKKVWGSNLLRVGRVGPVYSELACVEWGLGRAFGGCCNKEGLGFKSFKGREGWAGV